MFEFILHKLRKVQPGPIIRKHQETLAGFSHERRLEDIDFVVLDSELSSLSEKDGEIVSLAAFRIKNLSLNPADSFASLVKPRWGLPETSTLIHRLTSADLKDAPDICEVLEGFIEFIGDSALVGHHVGLDAWFLNKASRQCFGGELKSPCIDTLKLAQAFEEAQNSGFGEPQLHTHISYNLSDLSQRYGLPAFPSHEAASDAMQTAYLFLYLVGKLGQGRDMSLKDLWRAGRNWRSRF